MSARDSTGRDPERWARVHIEADQRPPLPPAVPDVDERATAIFYRLTVAWLILGLVVTTLLAFVVEP